MRQNDETGNTKITPLSLRPSWHDKPFEKPRRPALTKWKLSMEDTGTMIGVIIGIVGLLNILELLDQPEEGKWCMEGISGDDNQTDFSVPPTPTYYDLKQMDLKCRDLVVAFYMSISLSSASCCVAATALFFASHLRSWYLALTSAALHVTCMLSFPWETYVLWVIAPARESKLFNNFMSRETAWTLCRIQAICIFIVVESCLSYSCWCAIALYQDCKTFYYLRCKISTTFSKTLQKITPMSRQDLAQTYDSSLNNNIEWDPEKRFTSKTYF